jgi:hypothetical protein
LATNFLSAFIDCNEFCRSDFLKQRTDNTPRQRFVSVETNLTTPEWSGYVGTKILVSVVRFRPWPPT